MLLENIDKGTSSGYYYDKPEKYFFTEGAIFSILIPGKTEVEFYGAENFDTDAYVIKNRSDEQKCFSTDPLPFPKAEGDQGMRSLRYKTLEFPLN